MTLVDLSLARRLERADAEAAGACVAALQRLRPGLGAVSIREAGGVAAFAGSDSPLSHAIGIGMDGPVGDDEFDRVEALFLDRGAAAVFEFSPLADPSLSERLGKRGYRAVEFGNVLFREVRDEPEATLPPGVSVEVARPEEEDEWVAAVSEGFAGIPDLPSDLLDIARTLFRVRGAAPYLARFEGKPVGGGTLMVFGRVGALVGASVIDAFRGRGVHSALMSRRLRDAKRAGCDLVTMGAVPGGGSHRNAERLGLRVAYTRVSFRREPV